MRQKLFGSVEWVFTCVCSGPPNNPRYGEASRLRQPVDGSADSDRDAAASGRQQQRNGNAQLCIFSYACLQLLQGDHKPGVVEDFSEHGKLTEFCAT